MLLLDISKYIFQWTALTGNSLLIAVLQFGVKLILRHPFKS